MFMVENFIIWSELEDVFHLHFVYLEPLSEILKIGISLKLKVQIFILC